MPARKSTKTPAGHQMMYTPSQNFFALVDGREVAFTKDRTRVSADHPTYLATPGLFEEVGYAPTVEAATADPGEEREVVVTAEDDE